MTKFNNIIDPIINKNLKTIVPIAITEKLNVIIRKTKTKKDLVDFLHCAMFSPVPSKWIKGTENNQFSTWPVLDRNLVSKHLRSKIATVEGHLNQEQEGLQSTKQKLPLRNNTTQSIKKNNYFSPTTTNFFPTSETPNLKTRDVIYSITSFDDTKVYSDQTG